MVCDTEVLKTQTILSPLRQQRTFPECLHRVQETEHKPDCEMDNRWTAVLEVWAISQARGLHSQTTMHYLQRATFNSAAVQQAQKSVLMVTAPTTKM